MIHYVARWEDTEGNSDTEYYLDKLEAEEFFREIKEANSTIYASLEFIDEYGGMVHDDGKIDEYIND